MRVNRNLIQGQLIMNFKFLHKILALAILMALTGCGPRDTRYFPKLKTNKAAQVTQNNITISINVLSRQDCLAYFDCDVIAQGYRPLLLTIDNTTSDAYVLRPSYLDVERVSGKEIARFMHYDTYNRVLWFVVPAFYYAMPLIPCVIIPYGLSCRHYNQKTTRNIRKKTLGREDTVEIAPYETVQRFIFIPEESFKTILDIKLFNETTRMVEAFSVNCAQPLLKKER